MDEVHLIVVDEDVDVHDEASRCSSGCVAPTRRLPGRDLELVNGPLDILDHAAPQLGAGSKIGFDATRKLRGEAVGGEPVRDYPPYLWMSPDVLETVSQRWAEYGL